MNDIKRVADQIRRAGERLKPSAARAIDAIDHGVVEPAADAAAHGAKRLRRAVSAFLAAASDLLGDLSESVVPAEATSVKPAGRVDKTRPRPKPRKARPPRTPVASPGMKKPIPAKDRNKPKPAARRAKAKPSRSPRAR